MKEWIVSLPYYGKGEAELQDALNGLTVQGWTIFQILESTLCIVAYRQKGKN